ncbi:MAG: M20 family peptidase [Cyclobacteriaceae bacterium]|nr:M20 family peptidase [Cyclobacteriaceae bacterium]
MKKILPTVLFLIILFALYLGINTSRLKSKQRNVAPVNKVSVSPEAVVHLSEAIQIRTISFGEESDFDSLEFYRFSELLDRFYPLASQTLTRSTINSFGLLYHWQGADNTLAPIVLAAHYDVVPADEADSAKWLEPPFSGKIHENYIWGRGTLDDKVSVIGIMEAVEIMIGEGFVPNRSVYLAFGHDEEIGGLNGAKAIADYLKSRGIKPEFVLDEGLTITQGLVPGVLTDVALIGIAEKGFATIQLSVELDGGHSSMPLKETAIQIITNALTKLGNKPFKARISEPVHRFLDFAGPEMRLQDKLAFANRNLFKSLILGIYQQSPAGNALVQTTMVPTIIGGGYKDNVIPSNASATMNFRILPGSSVEDVVQYVKETVADDRIQLTLSDFLSEPSPVSDPESQAYLIIEKSIKEIYPEVIVVPNLVLGATDGRYYYEICENVYRFLPLKITQENITSLHGINERIPVGEFEDVIRFYRDLTNTN